MVNDIDYDALVGNIVNSCDSLGRKGLHDIPLESADPRLLDVSESNFNEHVSLQPSAIAFFGMLKKQSSRMLDNAKIRRDRLFREKLIETKKKLKGTKALKDEVEATVYMDYADEMEKMDEEVNMRQTEFDTLDVWYEAWRSKSFTLHEFGLIMNDEIRSSPSMGDTGVYSSSPKKHVDSKRLKDIIRKSRSSS